MDLTTDDYDVTVVTRGHLHHLPADCPQPDIEFDLRRLLSDPAHRPEGDMLDLTGLDPKVREFVFATQGARELVATAVPLVFMLAQFKHVTVMVGCAGGKHRAAAIGQELADRLERFGLRVKVVHLHKDLPRVIKAA
jgi:RNase adaptor protein for sRNA GlmZ degradation